MINKEQIICEISSKKIIAIARGIYGEQCINLAKALYDGGISLLEITYDQSNSQSVQDTADTLRALNSALGDKMMFGAGTVISAQQVTVAVDEPMIIGCAIMVSVCFTLLMIGVDLIYAFIDPRIRAKYRKRR